MSCLPILQGLATGFLVTCPQIYMASQLANMLVQEFPTMSSTKAKIAILASTSLSAALAMHLAISKFSLPADFRAGNSTLRTVSLFTSTLLNANLAVELAKTKRMPRQLNNAEKEKLRTLIICHEVISRVMGCGVGMAFNLYKMPVLGAFLGSCVAEAYAYKSTCWLRS